MTPADAILERTRRMADVDVTRHAGGVILRPADAAAAAEVLAWCSANGVSVRPVGHGGRSTMPDGGVWISAARMNAVIEHEPADLVVGAGAGITVGALNRHLRTSNQLLPFQPPTVVGSSPADGVDASLGSLLACNEVGDLQTGFGTPRDSAIGIELVTGDGRVLRFGGRVVKNVAGYDGVRLAVGSLGALGLITAAFTRVRALPIAERTLAWRVPADRIAETVPALRNAAAAEALDVLTPAAATAWDADATHCAVVARLLGGPEDVAARAESLSAVARQAALPESTDQRRTGASAPATRTAVPLHAGGAAGAGVPHPDLQSWRITGTVYLTDALDILIRMVEARSDVRGLVHVGTGRLVFEGAGAPDAAVNALRDVVPARCALWLHRNGCRQRLTGEADEVVLELTRRLLDVFDPAGILLPGRELLE